MNKKEVFNLMSKKKDRKWFSVQKIVDEMNELTIEELESYEQEEQMAVSEALTVIPQAQTNLKDKKSDQESSSFSEKTTITFTTQESFEERQKMDKEQFKKINEQNDTNENEDEIMDKKQRSNNEINKKKSQEPMTEHLGFEIKELILENEQLQAEIDLLKQQNTESEKNRVAVKVTEEKLAEAEIKINDLEEQLQKKELEKLRTQYNDLNETLEAEKKAREQEYKSYEKKLSENEQTIVKREQTIKDLERKLSEKEVMIEEQKATDSTIENGQLQAKIEALREENAALQIENEQFQTEISEVLVFARRKANRTIQEAKIESERMIRTTEMRIDGIHDRAKEILFEVNETKENVIHLFDDLHNQVYQLSDKKLLFEELEK